MYRISTVSEMTGIPRNTLLAWERRYNLLSPDRTESGYRTYSDEDVAKLRQIKEWLDQGYKISEAIALLRRTEAPSEVLPEDQDEAVAEVCRALRDRLLAFDRTGAESMRRRLVLFSFERSIDGVYLPLLREIGDLWHRGEATVAQEHFASAFCREQLTAMLHSLGAGPEGGPLVVCAGIPKELHELGLLATAVKLALRGCRVSYLGADLPREDLAKVARDQGAALVCQSAVQRDPDEILEHARALHDLLGDIPLAIGGAATKDLEDPDPRIWFVQDVDALLARL